MAPIWGNLADRFGFKAMVIRAGLPNGIVYLLMSTVQTPWQLTLVRLLYGLTSGYMPAATALASSFADPSQAGKTMAFFQRSAILGQSLGPLLGGVFSAWLGIRTTFIVADIMMLINTGVIVIGVKMNRTTSKKARRMHLFLDIKEAFQSKGVGLIFLMFVMLQVSIAMLIPVIGLFVPQLILPIHTMHALTLLTQMIGRRRMDLVVTGAIFSLPSWISFIVVGLWGRYSDHVGRKIVLMFTLIGGALFVGLQSLTQTVIGLGLLRLGSGAFMSGVKPNLNALITDLLPANIRGRIFAIMGSAMSIGTVTGSLLGGFMGTTWGLRSVFVASAMSLLGVATILLGLTTSNNIEFRRKATNKN